MSYKLGCMDANAAGRPDRMPVRLAQPRYRGLPTKGGSGYGAHEGERMDMGAGHRAMVKAGTRVMRRAADRTAVLEGLADASPEPAVAECLECRGYDEYMDWIEDARAMQAVGFHWGDTRRPISPCYWHQVAEWDAICGYTDDGYGGAYDKWLERRRELAYDVEADGWVWWAGL